MKNTKSKQSKIVRYITAPLRKLNNLYMAGMSNCAATMDHQMGADKLSMAPQALPRNFSVSSSKGSSRNNDEDDDFSELVRVVSTRFNNNNAAAKNPNKFQDVMKASDRWKKGMMMPMNGGGRSYSVGVGKIGKIDEDGPCDDFEEVEIAVVAYPRSRSDYAFARRNINLVPNNVYQR